MSNSSNKWEVPDKALMYVVSQYMTKKSVESVSLSVGIPSDAVEDIICLFLSWAENSNYVEDNVLTLELEER